MTLIIQYKITEICQVACGQKYNKKSKKNVLIRIDTSSCFCIFI